MSRLPRVNARRVLAALQRGGFVLDHVNGSHHVLIGPSGQRVVVPVHPGTLKVGLLTSILRQTRLTADEFLELL